MPEDTLGIIPVLEPAVATGRPLVGAAAAAAATITASEDYRLRRPGGAATIRPAA